MFKKLLAMVVATIMVCSMAVVSTSAQAMKYVDTAANGADVTMPEWGEYYDAPEAGAIRLQSGIMPLNVNYATNATIAAMSFREDYFDINPHNRLTVSIGNLNGATFTYWLYDVTAGITISFYPGTTYNVYTTYTNLSQGHLYRVTIQNNVTYAATFAINYFSYTY
jgi:hypothetical protein